MDQSFPIGVCSFAFSSGLDLIPPSPLHQPYRTLIFVAPSKDLNTFPNPQPNLDYTVRIRVPEFTCLCPMTGQPDFAELLFEYVPNELCVELKSLKLYVWAYRDQGAYHEAVTNRILDDLVAAIKPRFIRLTADFNVRGGIYTTVVVEHRMEGWNAPVRVFLP